MNGWWDLVLSLSLCGGVLILGILLCRRFLKGRVSRTWQYYLWLVVLARLLLPIHTEVDLPEGMPLPSSPVVSTTANSLVAEPTAVPVTAQTSQPVEVGESIPAPAEPDQTWDPQALLGYVWLLWLVGGLVLLLRKVVVYRNFAGLLRSGGEEVTDPSLLDQLEQAKAEAGVSWPVGLYVNPMAASPMLLGFFRSYIVLPTADLPARDLHYILLHELTHCRRGDMFYKWLVQFTCCLHWFNPLVWLMAREINRDCELACDEAVIRSLDEPARRAYGDTLLHAMEAGLYQKSMGAVSLSESAQRLKERLGAVMNFGKKKYVAIPLVLSLLLVCGAVAAGIWIPAEETESMQKSGQMQIWFNNYYIFDDGTTEEDIPPVLFEEVEQLVLVKKDSYAVIGPFGDVENIPDVAREQCLELVDKGELTRSDMRLLMDGAEELQKERVAMWEKQEEPDTIHWGVSEEEEHEGWISYTEIVYPETMEKYQTPSGIHQGPYIISLSWNVKYYTGEPEPSKTFLLWDQTEQKYVTLTAYFSEYSEKIMDDPEAWKVLCGQMAENYFQRKKVGNQAINFRVDFADYVGDEGAEALAEKCYEDSWTFEFRTILTLLPEETRLEWLERVYEAGDKTFFASVWNCENADDAMLEEYAQRAYDDDKLDIFDALTSGMDRATLERWQAKAAQDGRNLYDLLIQERLRWVA